VFQAEKNAKTSPHKTFAEIFALCRSQKTGRYAHSDMHLFP
jgi:hypothetical protein